MIEKLTPRQIKKQEEVRDYWVNLALKSGDEIDEKEAKSGIDWLYTQANLPKVEMLVVDSPLGIQYALNLIKNSDKDKIWNSVENSVENSVRNSVWNSVWNSVRNSVWNSVGNEKLNLFEFNWQNLGNIAWFAFYDYFYSFKIYDEETKKNFRKYKKFLQSGVFFSSCYSDIAVVCRRPQFIRRNDTEQLHSDQLPAIEWRDGYKLWFLDGVEFTEELWNRVISKEMTLSEIMKIEISDQRTVALKYNPQAIIKENAKLIHKDNRSNELYLVENSEINKLTNFPKMYFLKMTCPTGRIFIEGVDPVEAEKNPNATDMQAMLCGLTPSEYQSMTMES